MYCAISGVTPEEPVISKLTGHVYEKRLIEQHLLASGGKDPETGEDMTKDDLIEVKVTGSVVRPNPITASSIPGALTSLRNEWDAVMLETFKLKQSLKSTRLELSHSLYYYDAALRVIARLVKERDEARKALAELREKGVVPQDNNAETMNGKTNANDKMDIDTDAAKVPEGFSDNVLSAISEKADELKKWRMKRPAVEGLLKPAEVAGMAALPAFGEEGAPVTSVCSALRQTDKEQGFLFVGDESGSCRAFSGKLDEIQTFEAFEKKKITGIAVTAATEVVALASDAGDVVVMKRADGKYDKVSSWTPHSSGISGCTMQATDKLFGTCALDGLWAVNDIESGKALTLTKDPEDLSYTAAQFHPDGAIFATGTATGIIRIWDVRSLSVAATFDTELGAAVSSVRLSENGYYLSSLCGGSKVQLWDLRKQKATKSADFEASLNIKFAAFDLSGGYLAMSGPEVVKVYDVKKWKELKTFESKGITDVAWDRTASRLFCGTNSGSISTFGK